MHATRPPSTRVLQIGADVQGEPAHGFARGAGRVRVAVVLHSLIHILHVGARPPAAARTQWTFSSSASFSSFFFALCCCCLSRHGRQLALLLQAASAAAVDAEVDGAGG